MVTECWLTDSAITDMEKIKVKQEKGKKALFEWYRQKKIVVKIRSFSFLLVIQLFG